MGAADGAAVDESQPSRCCPYHVPTVSTKEPSNRVALGEPGSIPIYSRYLWTYNTRSGTEYDPS